MCGILFLSNYFCIDIFKTSVVYIHTYIHRPASELLGWMKRPFSRHYLHTGALTQAASFGVILVFWGGYTKGCSKIPMTDSSSNLGANHETNPNSLFFLVLSKLSFLYALCLSARVPRVVTIPGLPYGPTPMQNATLSNHSMVVLTPDAIASRMHYSLLLVNMETVFWILCALS